MVYEGRYALAWGESLICDLGIDLRRERRSPRTEIVLVNRRLAMNNRQRPIWSVAGRRQGPRNGTGPSQFGSPRSPQ